MSTFACIDHKRTAQDAAAQDFAVNMAPVAEAIRELTEKMKPEVRIDLPAMNPTFQSGPVSVTVPEFPPLPPWPEQKAPIVTVHVPEPAPSQLVLNYKALAALALAQPIVFALVQWAISYAIAR